MQVSVITVPPLASFVRVSSDALGMRASKSGCLGYSDSDGLTGDDHHLSLLEGLKN